MQQTPNLGLKKPEGTDVVDIGNFNDNSDILDSAVAEKAPLASPTFTGTVTAANLKVSGPITSAVATGSAPLAVTSTTKVTNLNADKLDGYDASTTAVANTIPVYNSSAQLVGGITGNAATATKLATARAISLTGDGAASVTFDGSAAASGTLTLSNSGVSAGTYRSVTVDAKGRVTAGTNPTTLNGYGITDAAPLSHVSDLTSHVPYAAATGSANAYAVTLSPAPTSLPAGLALAVKINVANTGASTINVNALGAKSILNSKGAALASGKLVANGIYTLRYNGTAFILQGEGGEYGTAGADQILSGYTVGTENGIVSGTLQDKRNQAVYGGAEGVLSLEVYSGNTAYGKLVTRPSPNNSASKGYMDSTTKLEHHIHALLPDNIKYGVQIGGSDLKMTGTFTGDATATADKILSGYTAYVNGVKVTGTGRRSASGSATTISMTYTSGILVTGLGFTPSLVFAKRLSGTNWPSVNILFDVGLLNNSGFFTNASNTFNYMFFSDNFYGQSSMPGNGTEPYYGNWIYQTSPASTLGTYGGYYGPGFFQVSTVSDTGTFSWVAFE
ncbi:hypothetical protein [Cohnella thailandensis]|uniref:Uncharacterized protein n=1 Tax=Cohnella thailandensis TaxID=557557 RepID=A0A841T4V3_9BACL|nr:hypothetical protein [Cohnella thailandensis]MBB6637358.1 hypothetical protein [Cohnella thailandensis]MBP1976687.1 hypothetical protein [Cohnella thailandensis]